MLNDYLSVDEAAAIAATYEPNEGPLVIADYADNPGAGGYGDSTELLRALLEAGVSNACFGPMVDGEVAQAIAFCGSWRTSSHCAGWQDRCTLRWWATYS